MPSPLKEGYLKKKSPKAVLGRHVWQKRYFILEPSRLLYFKKKPGEYARDDDELCLGVIPAEAIKCIEEMAVSSKVKSRCRFNIILNGTARTFQLQTPSAFTCQRWVAALGRLGASIDHVESSLVHSGEKFWKAKNYNRNKRRQAIAGTAPNPKRAEKAKGKRVTEKSEDTTGMVLFAVGESVAFQALDDEQRRQIVQLMWRVEIKKGTEIIMIDERGDHFYVLEKGSVGVFERGDKGSDELQEVNIQHGGSSFGELSLMYNAKSKKTYKAMSDCVLWTVDRGLFQSTLANVMEQRLHMYEEFLRSTELIGTLDDEQIAKVSEALEEKFFKGGDNIVTQGEQGDAFYILKSGKAVVYVDGNEVTRYTRGGDYFGERSLIKNQVRAATVTAVGPVTVLFLDRSAFSELLGPLQDIMKQREEEYKQDASPGVSKGSVRIHVKRGGEDGSPAATPRPSQVAQPKKKREQRPRINDVADLRVIGTLGKGTFGHVQLVEDSAGFTYALKSISKAHIVKHNQQEHIISEKMVMEKLDHPFIVRLYQTMRDNNFLYLMLEPSLGGELFSALRERVKFDENTARFYAAGVLLAFEHMHSLDIVYRDLKPENLLLDNNGYLKITDFGFAKKIKNRTWTFCGTPDYLAPEVLSSTGHGKGVDWWTLGILIYEMLAGFPPFYDDQSVNKIYAKILVGKVPYQKFFTEEAKSIVGSLLQIRATRRLGVLAGGAGLIKEHPWFNGFDWKDFLAQRMKAPLCKPVKDKFDISNFDEYPDDDDYEEYDPRDAEDPTWDDCFE